MTPDTEELERVHHELRQCLRVTGVGPLLAPWSAQEAFLVAVWDAARPCVETRAFEEAADRLRCEAVALADGLDRLSALKRAELGESQAYQAEAAIRLHHYLTPKLLLLAAAVGRGLRQPGRASRSSGSRDLIERGVPARMGLFELVDERAAEPALQRIFKDISRVTGARAAPPLLRALALWPRYLESAWERLKPALETPQYAAACQKLGAHAAELAGALPYAVELPLEALARVVDLPGAKEDSAELEKSLPALCVDAALLGLDWQAPEILRRSPFPARARAAVLAEAA